MGPNFCQQDLPLPKVFLAEGINKNGRIAAARYSFICPIIWLMFVGILDWWFTSPERYMESHWSVSRD
jgi:hypothetical protein